MTCCFVRARWKHLRPSKKSRWIVAEEETEEGWIASLWVFPNHIALSVCACVCVCVGGGGGGGGGSEALNPQAIDC